MIAQEQPPADSQAHDEAILVLWKRKFDTVDIAKRLGLKEWQVANRLLQLRGQCS